MNKERERDDHRYNLLLKIYYPVPDPPPWPYPDSLRRYVPPKFREINGLWWGQGLGLRVGFSETIHQELVLS